MPIYWQERGQFVVFTSIGLPQKAFNIRHNPQVSMLFSDSTGSDLNDPPAVLVRGEAQVAEEIISKLSVMDPELLHLVKRQAVKMIERQPAMKLYTSNPLSRYLMDWYFMRLIITITPTRFSWWAGGDMGHLPTVQEVNYVV